MLFTCRRLVAAVLLKALSGCRTGETPGQEDHGDVVVTNSASYSDYVAGMLLVNDFLGQRLSHIISHHHHHHHHHLVLAS